MPLEDKYVDLGTDGCLCKDEDRYSVECCDEDDRWAERMGRGTAPVEEEEDEEP